MNEVQDNDIEEVITFHKVSQTLYRYASSVDTKDWETLRSLFTDDAVGEYSHLDPISGADAIVAWIQSMTADRNWQHHLINVYHVDRTGPETATALTYHTSHQTGEGVPDEVTLLVARYRDELRMVDGRWKIARKQMQTGWREVRSIAQP